MNYNLQMENSLKSLVSNRTEAVYDFEFVKALRDLPWREWFEEEGRPLDCQGEYVDFYPKWIASSEKNKFTGLDHFPFRTLINGTTQCFDEAYFRYKERRLRIFRGEYAYHKRICTNFVFIEDEPIKENDWVIVSTPFCSTGDVHPEFFNLLDQAHKKNVPVIVDCAFFGTCSGVNVDLSHPAITEVCFSLTKGLGMGDMRSGIRFSKTSDLYPIDQQNKFKHNVLLTARIGLYMMKKFGPDHIANKFLKHQESVCKDLGITPTPCMHIGLGKIEEWPGEFLIDEKYCRIGLKHAVKSRSQGRV